MSIKAIVIQGPNDAKVVETSAPKPRDDYITVDVKAVALNPTDWKHIAGAGPKGVRVGCDYSGIVTSVGPSVSKSFKAGDRVAGFAHGANTSQPEDGAFAETIVAKGDLQIKIPDNLSFEEAATLGVGVGTCGQGLYQSLKLPLPGHAGGEKFPVLIYGGSTATGSLAIQYAKASGLQVITTCSEHNFDYVKSLGAEKAFDYKSPTCAEDIRAYTSDNLHHIFDCISEGSSIPICANAMSSSGGQYSNLLMVSADKLTAINPKIECKGTLAYTTIGEAFSKFGHDFPASKEDFEFAKKFWELTRTLLEKGELKPHTPAVNEGGKGLEGVLVGLGQLKDGKVSGKKLVYTL